MSIDLMGVEVKHEQRVRLTFTNNLAAGAFKTPAPLYVITVDAASATAPTVSSAMIVPGSPAVVELALSNVLVRDVIYTITAVGIPASDASVTPAGSVLTFKYGAPLARTSVEPYLRDRDRLLLGSDIIWNGSDYEETPNGDLALVEGAPNVTKALWRSIETQGLPWDPTWGVSAREYVDSPSAAGSTLRGAMARQVGRDPRVKSVEATITQEGNATYINITPTLISGIAIAPVSTKVDNGST